MALDLSPIKNCPNCGYSLEGLPAPHRCPECGFEYEAEMIAFPRGRAAPSGPMIAVATLSFGVAVLVMLILMSSSATERVLWLFAFFVPTIIIAVWRATVVRGPGRVFLFRDGVLIVADSGQRENIPWRSFTSVRWRFLDGCVLFESADGEILWRIPPEYFNSHRTARAFVHLTHGRKIAHSEMA